MQTAIGRRPRCRRARWGARGESSQRVAAANVAAQQRAAAPHHNPVFLPTVSFSVPPPSPFHISRSLHLHARRPFIPYCLSCRSDQKVISQGRTKAAEKGCRPCCFGWPGLEEAFNCIMLPWLSFTPRKCTMQG